MIFLYPLKKWYGSKPRKRERITIWQLIKICFNRSKTLWLSFSIMFCSSFHYFSIEMVKFKEETTKKPSHIQCVIAENEFISVKTIDFCLWKLIYFYLILSNLKLNLLHHIYYSIYHYVNWLRFNSKTRHYEFVFFLLSFFSHSIFSNGYLISTKRFILFRSWFFYDFFFIWK